MFVHGGDENAVVGFDGSTEAEEQIMAVVVHARKQTQPIGSQNQGKADQQDQKILSRFRKPFWQKHRSAPRVKKP
jgi:hypothetical protein